ncbi:MAG: hypothetical protein ACOYCB_11890 [Fastidiosipilaceae bacterium]
MQNRVRNLFLTILLAVYTFALIINYQNEITSGGFASKLLTFIILNLDNNVSEIFHSNWGNTFYQTNLLSMGENLKGLAIIFIIMSLISGLRPEYMMLFPLGVIMTPISYYVLTKRIFNSSIIASLLGTYILMYCISSADQIGAYVASWAFILLLLAIFIIYNLFSCNTNEYLLILYILYLGAFLYWHTMEARILFFILSVLLLLFIKSKADVQMPLVHLCKKLSLIFIASLTTTLAFKQLLYKDSGYFAQSSIDILFQSYLDWFSSILARVGLGPQDVIYNGYYYTDIRTFSTISTTANLILIVLIVFPIAMLLLMELINYKKITLDKPLVLILAIILLQVILTIAYGLTGGAGPGLIILLFPIASLLSIMKICNRINTSSKGTTVVSIFLVILILLHGMGSLNNVDKFSDDKKRISYSEFRSSSDWFIKNTDIQDLNTPKVLTDFQTAGKVLVNCGYNGVILNYICYNPLIYSKMFEYDQKSGINKDWDYIYLNRRSIESPIGTDQGWRPLIPLARYITIIEGDDGLNKVYNDGRANVFSFV